MSISGLRLHQLTKGKCEPGVAEALWRVPLSLAVCVKACECVITDQHAHAVLFASQRDLSQRGRMKAYCYCKCTHLSLNVACSFSKQCGVSFHQLQNVTCLFAALQKPLISLSLCFYLSVCAGCCSVRSSHYP